MIHPLGMKKPRQIWRGFFFGGIHHTLKQENDDYPLSKHESASN